MPSKSRPTLYITDTTIVEFVPLVRNRESDGSYYIGREDTGVYLHLEEDIAEVMRLCDGKRNLIRAVGLYCDYKLLDAKKGRVLLDRVKSLTLEFIRDKFVKKLNGIELQKDHVVKLKNPKYPWIVRAFLSPKALVLKFLFLAIGILLVVNNPGYFPKAEDTFWHPYLAISLGGSFLFEWLMLGIHEISHYFSAKIYGATAKLGFSRRYFYFVAQTDVINGYKLPRSKRVNIYLSGIAIEGLIIGISMILLFLNDRQIIAYPELLSAFLRSVNLTLWMGILWQFSIYLETDIYALVADLSGIDNLLFYANANFRVNFYKFFGTYTVKSKEDLRNSKNRLKELKEDQRSLLSKYMLLFVLGYCFSTFELVYYRVPRIILVLLYGISSMYIGIQNNDWLIFFNGFVPTAITLFNNSLLIWTFVRKEDKEKIEEKNDRDINLAH